MHGRSVTEDVYSNSSAIFINIHFNSISHKYFFVQDSSQLNIEAQIVGFLMLIYFSAYGLKGSNGVHKLHEVLISPLKKFLKLL